MVRVTSGLLASPRRSTPGCLLRSTRSWSRSCDVELIDAAIRLNCFGIFLDELLDILKEDIRSGLTFLFLLVSLRLIVEDVFFQFISGLEDIPIEYIDVWHRSSVRRRTDRQLTVVA